MELLTDLLSQPFIWYAYLTIILFACNAGFIGCFLIWRNLAFLGDSLAHSALLGIAIAYSISVIPQLGMVLSFACYLFIFILLYHRHRLISDAFLSAIAHCFFAVGILVLSRQTISFDGILFGDILSVTRNELYITGVISLVLLALLWRYRAQLVLVTYDRELAQAEGLPVKVLESFIIIAAAIICVFALKTIGVLLISSLIVFPALIGSQAAKSWQRALLISVISGIVCATVGFIISLIFDFPPGPAIVVAQMSVYGSLLVAKRVFAI